MQSFAVLFGLKKYELVQIKKKERKDEQAYAIVQHCLAMLRIMH